jgi:hypothetical protein
MNTYGQPSAPAAKPRKKRRVFLWVFLAIQVIFLIWVIAGGASTGGGVHSETVAYCHAHPSAYVSYQTCLNDYSAAGKAGTAIGVGLIIVFWFIVDVILGITYGVYRLATRTRA